MVLVVIYSACVVGHQKVFRGHRHPGRERAAGRFFLSRFCRVLLTGVFVALRPKLAVRNVLFSAWRRYDAREMKCVRGSERKHTYVSFRPFPSASPRRSNALANRKRVVKTDPSLVGVRLGSVSRLRQLITIGELSTELCLSCVRDITADARRTYDALKSFRASKNEREHLRLTRFKVLSSQTSDGTDNDFLIIGVRAYICRRNRNAPTGALYSAKCSI